MVKRVRRAGSIQKLLQASTSPLFVLSDRRIVTFFNAGCEELTGWRGDEVVGQRCDYRSEGDPADPASIPSTLCPPPEVFEGEPASVPAYFPHRDGRSLPRLIHFVPLFDGAEPDRRVTGVMGIIAAMPQPRSAAPPTLAQQLHAELAAERGSVRARFGLKSVVAKSEPMLRVVRQAAVARASNAPVLLQGEAGVGRQHLARVIHSESDVRHRCFVPLDCASLPPFEVKQTLRRLFSHDPEDLRNDASPFSSLQPGTVYLGNVEHLPRDLQEFLVQETGKGDASRVPLRIIAGTSADLSAALSDETLRSDFYFLITALIIEIPPLRSRRAEIPLLAQAFLEDLNRGADRQRSGFSEDVLRQFSEYRWPGNLAELSTVVGEAWEAAPVGVIQASDLPFRFRTGQDAQQSGPSVATSAMPLEQYLEQVEKERIVRTLELVKQNKSRAAELLGMPRPRLYRRMVALGLADDEAEERTSAEPGNLDKNVKTPVESSGIFPESG